MSWWLWIIVALAFYLLVSMAPWIVLQIAIWRIRRRLPFMAEETRQLERLMAVEREHADRWPARPRPGRYEQVDRLALEQLLRMRVIIGQANDLWPGVAGYVPDPLNPIRVLALGAWRPLVQAVRVWRAKRSLDTLLAEGDTAIAMLLEQWTEAQSIPQRIQAELSDARAEARRLRALWEGEIEAGTRGIEPLGDALALLDRRLGEALDGMRAAAEGQMAAVTLESESQLAQATEALGAFEQELGVVIEGRKRAQQTLAQARAGLDALTERWNEMQAHGAKDPAVARGLSELAAQADELEATVQEATPQAYATALERTEGLAAAERMLGEQMDALEEAMRRSQEALAGDVGALASAQQECEALRAAGAFEPDLSEGLVARAREIFAQAEEQQALGTLHGYQTAVALAEQARQAVREAAERAEACAQDLAQIEADQQQAAPDIRKALRERARGVSEALRAYVHHWDSACEARLERIATLFEQADESWAGLPAALLQGGMPRQSEVAKAREAMQQAAAATQRARQLVEELEGRLTRVAAQRKLLQEGLAELDGELGPKLAAVKDAMLPELRDRYEAWLARYEAERPDLRDAGQINYDQAADHWLPEQLNEAREILAAHQADVARYRKSLQEAQRQLERDWQRLSRLDPMQMPLPEENLERLAADYDAWQAEGDAHTDDPAVMSELVSRRAPGLERRIEAARRQINEGRQALATLDRQFEQQMQAVQKSRAALRALVQESQWRQIEWELADGEPLVQRAVTYQEASRQAELLDEAVNQMRRAVNTAQEAVQAYQGMEQQLRSAQDGLNREFRAATADLDRAQRQAGQLRTQGPSEALRSLEEGCASATSLISMAQGASSFEDALRYLREARERLARS